ncbi:MAG: nicotinate-nucleotide adenylyltransferase [Pseudomonadota bacterium]
MRLIGVLGGTFDPIHIGHLRLAIEMLDQAGLAEVRLVPNGIPNHRKKAVGSDELRLAMLAEVASPPNLVVDAREIERGGVSYMVDTLASLKHDYPQDSLCLILGMDAYTQLPTWDRWRQLFELSHILVATRPGSEPALDKVLADATENRIISRSEELGLAEKGKILFIDIPLLDISASDIRRRRKAGLSINHLVTADVEKIIEQHRLYIN